MPSFRPKARIRATSRSTQSPDAEVSTPHAGAGRRLQPAKQTDKPAANGRSSAKPGKESPEPAADKPDSESKRSLPSGFYADRRLGILAGRLAAANPLHRVDGAEMALVTGGAVIVGHDGDPAESSPQITVVVDSFYMDRSEVTLARYKRYRKEVNEEHGRHAVQEPDNASSPADFPVLGVTLKQAEFYAHWAKKELPTEAEWERAARGEAAFAHPWGNGRAIWSQARDRTHDHRSEIVRHRRQPLRNLRPGGQRPRMVHRPLVPHGIRGRSKILVHSSAELERSPKRPSRRPRRQGKRPRLGRLVSRRHERHPTPRRRRLSLRAAAE